ncbi:hypothetical protein niasHT_009677 [Heterodera trifolii]|uniref:RING-type domain-containing protein n=1 Tax=Heterodera trifolii TaxID=157864 RepID=A0ABD2MFT7_9BILA
MHLIFLLLLPTVGCDGQKGAKHNDKMLKYREKEPKDSDKMDKVQKDSGKMPAQIAGGREYFLLEKYGQQILGKNSKRSEQLRKVFEGLNKKQCLLKSIFSKNSKNKYFPNDNFSLDEFKFFKNRWSEICQNDTALSQLLEGLFSGVISANEAMKKEDTNEMHVQQKTLKQSLAYAVFFMAKRGQIPLESPQEKKQNGPKAILIELIDIYNELQLDDEKMKESCRKCGKKGKGEKGQKERERHGQKGKKEKGQQKERRFLQFVARSLEIEWDANAFSVNGQNDKDDDDAIGRRRRRRRKRMEPTKSDRNTDQYHRYLLIYFGVLLVVGILIIFRRHCSCANFLRSQPRANIVASTPPHPQGTQFTIHEFQVSRNGVWAELECTICLGEIEKETSVKLLAILDPCKHIFHNECISEWLKNHNTCPICRANAKISVPSLNEVIIDVPSADGQNEGNTVGTGTDEVQVNQRNNGTANGPN